MKSDHNEAVRRALAALEPICGPSLTLGHALISQQRPSDAPDEWRVPFRDWLDENCIMSNRVYGGVKHLHNDFCEREVGNAGVPCTLATFNMLLTESDWEICDGLVAGLTTRKTARNAGYSHLFIM